MASSCYSLRIYGLPYIHRKIGSAISIQHSWILIGHNLECGWKNGFPRRDCFTIATEVNGTHPYSWLPSNLFRNPVFGLIHANVLSYCSGHCLIKTSVCTSTQTLHRHGWVLVYRPLRKIKHNAFSRISRMKNLIPPGKPKNVMDSILRRVDDAKV